MPSFGDVSLSVRGWDTITSGFWKQTCTMLQFYFWFWCLCLHRHQHDILYQPTQFYPNRANHSQAMTSWRFARWRPRHRNSTYGFVCCDFAVLIRSKFTSRSNFGEISKSTVELLLLPVSENKRTPYWNFTSGFDFYVRIIVGVSFCICLSNFVAIGPYVAELWRHIHFSKWPPRRRNSTSGFVFCDFAQLWFQKSICRPNFGQTTKSTIEILLLPVSHTNVRPVWNLLPVSIFLFATLLACHFASACQISSKLDHPRQCYDVISVFQDGGQSIAILLPVSLLVTWLIYEGRNLPADQISVIYLNPRLTYYYFRFLKTRPPCWNSTSGFDFSCLCHHQHDILHLRSKFHPKRTIRCRVMTSQRFSRWRPSAMLNFLKVTTDHPRRPVILHKHYFKTKKT